MKKYKPIFMLMDEKYINAEADGKFYRCCLAVENENPQPSDYATIRQLFEMVLKAINRHDKDLLPDRFIGANGNLNLSWSLRFLEGQQIKDPSGVIICEKTNRRIPAHISDCALFVKEISSALTHNYTHHHNHYGFIAAFYAWVEFFKWYTTLVQQNK